MLAQVKAKMPEVVFLRQSIAVHAITTTAVGLLDACHCQTDWGDLGKVAAALPLTCSIGQADAGDFWDEDNELSTNEAVEDETPFVSGEQDEHGNPDGEDQSRATTADRFDGRETDDPNNNRSRSPASRHTDGQPRTVSTGREVLRSGQRGPGPSNHQFSCIATT